MPALVATFMFCAAILAMFRLDRDPEARVSPALWIATGWVIIGASRSVSQWLGYWPSGDPDWSSTQYLEGSVLERFILTGFVAAGVIVLATRRRRLGRLLAANGPILVFFAYGALSILWSDYPDVALKRWVRTFGNLVMVLIVMSDLDPRAALRALLRRTGFFLVPVSVLFIKYYPDLGRGYFRWSWEAYYTGVATDKNGLGAICMVFGLASVWRVLGALREDGGPRWGPVVAHGAILMMVMWLFTKANSATSVVCFVLGSTLLAVTSVRAVARRPASVHVVLIGVMAVALFGFLFNPGSDITGAVGRDATLTGRTVLWQDLLHQTVDPWFGAGYDSFWLGDRIALLWKKYYWHPNQAHNGYLEVFLNLGWMGVALIVYIMIWGYRQVTGAFHTDHEGGRLRLAYFVVAVVYNLTEAAFKVMHPVWIAHLLAVAVVPEPRGEHE
jgi:exopolysaccharide production protein ExoQ